MDAAPRAAWMPHRLGRQGQCHSTVRKTRLIFRELGELVACSRRHRRIVFRATSASSAHQNQGKKKRRADRSTPRWSLSERTPRGVACGPPPAGIGVSLSCLPPWVTTLVCPVSATGAPSRCGHHVLLSGRSLSVGSRCSIPDACITRTAGRTRRPRCVSERCAPPLEVRVAAPLQQPRPRLSSRRAAGAGRPRGAVGVAAPRLCCPGRPARRRTAPAQSAPRRDRPTARSPAARGSVAPLPGRPR